VMGAATWPGANTKNSNTNGSITGETCSGWIVRDFRRFFGLLSEGGLFKRCRETLPALQCVR
jgi:hypothetical protein